jgi:hypothetical protein
MTTADTTIRELRQHCFLSYVEAYQRDCTPVEAITVKDVSAAALWLLAGMGSEEAKRKVEGNQ